MIIDTSRIGEITKIQTILITPSYNGELPRDTANIGTLKQLRALRKDSTIALGCGLFVSGILAGAWSVEAEKDVDEKVIANISESLLPLRSTILQATVALGRISYGWMPFEEIYTIKDGRLVLERMKPLLHDITTILVDSYGNFRGFRQRSLHEPLGIDVPYEKCALINFDVEGGNLYGYPLLENVRAIQTMWDDCNAGAKRYDQKIAGSHFVVHYPPGTSIVDDETVDNSVVAHKLLTALESSGSMAMPSTTAEVLQEIEGDINVAKLYQWDITLLSDLSARQPSFQDRLKYLDSLKLRGLLIPERACTEGKYGTRAESESHIDLLITNMESIDRTIVDALNVQVVDQLLAINWGLAPGTVRLVAAPLIDDQIGFLRKLYLLMSGKQVDVIALQEKLNVPLGEQTNVDANAENKNKEFGVVTDG